MKLSIVVPAYNVQNYLSRCIDSLIEQDISSYEIIIVVDGATDDTGNIANQYACSYDCVKVIHQENRGLSGARNTGLRAAEGEYVMFVDSDDWVEKNSISILLRESQKYQLDVGVADFKYIDQFGNVTENDNKPLACQKVVSGPDYFKKSMETNSSLSVVWKSIYRTQFLFDNNLFFREGYNHEDEEWTPRVYLSAKRIRSIQLVFYYYYIHMDTISKNTACFAKNSLDLIDNCWEMKQLSMTIDDIELRNLFQNRIVGIYLSAFYKGKLLHKQHRRLVNNTFFDDMYISKSNISKVFLFKISKRLYYYVNYFIKKIETRL